MFVDWCLHEVECFCVSFRRGFLFSDSFLWGSWHPLFILNYLKLSSFTQSLCSSSPALHPSSKHIHANTHTHTLDSYLPPSTLHLFLLAAPYWKVNKSCGCGRTLSALICLWSCSAWKRPSVCLSKVATRSHMLAVQRQAALWNTQKRSWLQKNPLVLNWDYKLCLKHLNILLCISNLQRQFRL